MPGGRVGGDHDQGRPVAVARKATRRSNSGLGHTTLIGATNGSARPLFLRWEETDDRARRPEREDRILLGPVNSGRGVLSSEPIGTIRHAARWTP